jgi:hypothetical protein
MSLNSFIPEVWSSQLLVTLHKAHVFANLANHDYEGEIKSVGDTVRINGIGPVTVSTYVKDTDISSPQALTDAGTTLTISQSKYFNFAVDDVDKAQQTPKVMAQAMLEAAYALTDAIDTYVAGFYTDASAGSIGTSGSPVVVAVGTAANAGAGTTAYDYLVQLSQFLTQQSVPKQGRWAVVPPWITTMLGQDTRFTGFNTPEARMTMLTNKLDATQGLSSDAYLGRIGGMDVYESNNAIHIGGTLGLAGSQDVVLAGHSMALTYADNVVETEAYRPEKRFADAVKGLHLYGAKTVRPNAMAVAYLQHP